MLIKRAALASALLVGLTMPAAAETVGGIATGNVNLRAGPGSGYDRIRVIPKGAQVDVRQCDRWCRVTYGGDVGYVYGRYISTGLTPPPPRLDRAPARRQGYVQPLAPEYGPAEPLLPRSGYVRPLAPPRELGQPLRLDKPGQTRFGLDLPDPPRTIKRDPYGIPCMPLQRQGPADRPPLNC